MLYFYLEVVCNYYLFGNYSKKYLFLSLPYYEFFFVIVYIQHTYLFFYYNYFNNRLRRGKFREV